MVANLPLLLSLHATPNKFNLRIFSIRNPYDSKITLHAKCKTDMEKKERGINWTKLLDKEGVKAKQSLQKEE